MLDRGLIASASPGEGMSHRAAEDILIDVMRRIADGGVDDEAWDRALAHHRLETVDWPRSAEALTEIIAASYLHHRQWKNAATSLSPWEISPRELSKLAANVHDAPGADQVDIRVTVPIEVTSPLDQLMRKL